MSNGNVIYNRLDTPDKAYILRKGSIVYEIIPGYEFTLAGVDKIFGASEILIEHKYNVMKSRHFTIKEGDDCEFTPVPKENLLQSVTDYNIGWNIGQHLAEVITNMHKIVMPLEKQLGDTEKESKTLLAVFVNVANLYKEESKNRKKMSWLENFAKELENNEMFIKGMQFVEFSSKIKIDGASKNLDKFKKVYHKGDTICKKGDEADSLYILSNGKIKVSLDDGTVIDIITDKGSVIGEMAILLKDKRTANMTAVDDTTLISIDRNEIRGLFQSDFGVFISTITNLAMREGL